MNFISNLTSLSHKRLVFNHCNLATLYEANSICVTHCCINYPHVEITSHVSDARSFPPDQSDGNNIVHGLC